MTPHMGKIREKNMRIILERDEEIPKKKIILSLAFPAFFDE